MPINTNKCNEHKELTRDILCS